MLDKLGKRKSIIPFVLPVLVVCLFSLMFCPMAQMELKNLPVAVVNLDEGIELPSGTLNIGSEITEGLESGEGIEGTSVSSGLSATVSQQEENVSGKEASDQGSTVMQDALLWSVLESEESAESAFANHNYYALIVIPKDFTLSQIGSRLDAFMENASEAASTGGLQSAGSLQENAQFMGVIAQLKQQAAEVEDGSLKVFIDNAKSPLIATQLNSVMNTLFTQKGISAEISVENDGGYEVDASSPMSSIISQQLVIIPAVIGGLICAILISRVFRIDNLSKTKETAQTIGKQLVVALICSLLVALCAWVLVSAICGIELPFTNSILFVWLSTFCFIVLLLGFLDIALPLGVLVAITILVLGNMLGVLPYEVLQPFWQDFVYPWVPQRFFGDGVRAVMYLGEGAINSATVPLLIAGGIGVLLMLIKLGISGKSKTSEN